MVSILNNNEKLTPFVFYNRFLKEVAIKVKSANDIAFKLVENGDENVFDSNYSIEPITIPLILSLSEQLSRFYDKPIKLQLYNNNATKNVIKFLDKSDFFYVSGNNKNPLFPYGRQILDFDENYLGDLIKKDPRPEHKVRCFSLNDSELEKKILNFKTDDDKRDFLISEYVYIVRDHFQELLYDNQNTVAKTDLYVEILSELITNGVLHSKSNTYALMFVNKFATKFSISDNGIGFTESLKSKSEDFLYKPKELKNQLCKLHTFKINDKILENFNYIVETLFYSSLKNRKGLFDLMTSVVLDSNGYFRLHSENSQIIISSRMITELTVLHKLRTELLHIHRNILINGANNDLQDVMISIKQKMIENFKLLYINICQKYLEDYRFSSLRFFNVKFRGVHIEVEIPNTTI